MKTVRQGTRAEYLVKSPRCCFLLKTKSNFQSQRQPRYPKDGCIDNRYLDTIVNIPRRTVTMAQGNPSHEETSQEATAPTGEPGTRLVFTNPSGEQLVGILVKPEQKNMSNDVVVLCHGYMSNKNSCRFAEIADALADAGLCSFRFDHPCALNGESERHGEFRMGNHEEEVRDIKSAVDFLRHDKGMNVICVLGHSKGGTNVLKYAAEIGDVPKMINLAGRFQPMNGLEKRFGQGILEALEKAHPEGIERTEPWGMKWTMRWTDFLGRANLPMTEYAQTIKDDGKVELLCIHGKDDETISYEESKLCAQLSGSACCLTPGNHNFAHADEFIGIIVQFCTGTLKL
mmetsp:Transcript_3702/g.7569  ORF Transcript_3702/g.7569 Transcript_3702/m.7569 type:complete len:344 (-) Transcript_3702:2127-3158(-)